MNKINCLLGIAAWIGLGTMDVSAISFSLNPTSISSSYSGIIQLEITGISMGETVRIEQFPDLNGNGEIDVDESLWRSFEVTDNQIIDIDGIYNSNIPRDENDWVSGQIRTTINANSLQITRWTGQFLFRVTSVESHFFPAIASLTVQSAAPAQTLWGQVLSSNAPLSHGWVLAFDVRDKTSFSTAMVTNDDGSFTMGLPVGNYNLAAVKEGYVSKNNTTPIMTLGASQSIQQNVDLTPAQRFISGLLRDDQSGKGLPGIPIWAETADGWFTFGHTDAQGAFMLPATPGVWSVQPNNASLATLGYAGCIPISSLDTTGDSITNLEVFLPKTTALIYGKVIDTAGRNVVGVPCYARFDNQTNLATGISGITGAYTIGAISGQTNLLVSADEETLGIRGFLVARTNITIELPTSLGQLDLVIQRANAYLRGRVIDQFGAPIAGIKLRAEAQAFCAFKRTDADGQFEIGVIGGTWVLNLDPAEAARGHYQGLGSELVVNDYEDQNGLLLIFKAADTTLPTAPTLQAIGTTPEGGFQFQFSSETGIRYRIDRTADLRAWSPFTFVEATGSLTMFTAPNSSEEFRFYRVVVIP